MVWKINSSILILYETEVKLVSTHTIVPFFLQLWGDTIESCQQAGGDAYAGADPLECCVL